MIHATKLDAIENILALATVTVVHNSVLIQEHNNIREKIEYISGPEYSVHGKAPIKLQDHGDNSGVSYRNIWVREL